MDPLGQQVFTVWVTGELLPFGRDNTQYKESLKMMIDDHLDVICRWDDRPDAKLEWFQNGDHRDIRVMLHGRILKIYLVASESDVRIPQLQHDAKMLINKFKPED